MVERRSSSMWARSASMYAVDDAKGDGPTRYAESDVYADSAVMNVVTSP